MSDHATGDWSRTVDMIVVGAGAAGMTAALTGSLLGLEVVLIEKSGLIGGTSAISAGSVWIPNTHHAGAGHDSAEQAQRYLRATVGDRLRSDLCHAFLTRGPEMIGFLEARSDVRFRAYRHHPDYMADADGATLAGRVLEPIPFDGRLLGAWFRRLRAPMPEFMVLGGMMVDRTDIGHLLGAGRSLGSLRHALGLVARHAADRLRYPRGTRLVMGNALVGRLLCSLVRQKVQIELGAAATGLIVEQGRAQGIAAATAAGPVRLRARRGLVLATGGFSRHPALRRRLLPEPGAEHSPIIETITGDGVAMGIDSGGRLGEGHASAAFWAPVSVKRRRDGSTAVFPHFVLDRGKPGLIAVDSTGRRFVNEATPYHAFGLAILAAHRRRPSIPCFFICDHRFIARYGLGVVRPRGINLRPAIADGYVVRAESIAALAESLGLDAAALQQTVARNNELARTGVDADFAKGGNAYERNLGDPAHGPNPCLGPIEQAAFYAIRVYPGDIGASVGLVTDAHGRVLREDGRPLPGLYACGNDMDSMMAGAYPGPGITLGPAMTFAYLAALHASREPPEVGSR